MAQAAAAAAERAAQRGGHSCSTWNSVCLFFLRGYYGAVYPRITCENGRKVNGSIALTRTCIANRL
jgi:hypothetical protein